MVRFRFGDFELDAAAGRLTRAGQPVTVPARHLEVLAALLACQGQVVSKDALVEAAWRDVAVTDNSLEQAISSLRRALATGAEPPLIQTVPRQGYRFTGEAQRVAARAGDDMLDALIAPHRAFVEGRAALEVLRVAPPDAPLTRTVEALDPARVALPAALVRSVNTPEDLAEAEALLG